MNAMVLYASCRLDSAVVSRQLQLLSKVEFLNVDLTNLSKSS